MRIDVDYEDLSHTKQVQLGVFPGVDLITLKDGRVLGIDCDDKMRIFLYGSEDKFYDCEGECLVEF
jgi:hypothetical protein